MSEFPLKVAAAITQVMSSVKKLEKDSQNKFGKYAFAGIDAFLEATRPLCADAGLIIMQDEVSAEVVESQVTDDYGKTRFKAWLTLKFQFILAHASGEIWDSRLTRSVTVDASLGAQAYGAAQSYALKQFLRSLFQMATGDNVDADAHEQSALPSLKSKLSNRSEKPTEGFNASRATDEREPSESGSTAFDGALADLLGWADIFQGTLADYTSAKELLEAWSAPDTIKAFNALKDADIDRAKKLHGAVSTKTKELKDGR